MLLLVLLVGGASLAGSAALLAFLQCNWTGPPLPPHACEPLARILDVQGTAALSDAHAGRAALAIDGKEPHPLAGEPWLLVAACAWLLDATTADETGGASAFAERAPVRWRPRAAGRERARAPAMGIHPHAGARRDPFRVCRRGRGGLCGASSHGGTSWMVPRQHCAHAHVRACGKVRDGASVPVRHGMRKALTPAPRCLALSARAHRNLANPVRRGRVSGRGVHGLVAIAGVPLEPRGCTRLDGL